MTPSPCIGSCRLDPAAQLCTGCARSGGEIAAWKDADPASRARIWADLPRRRAALGIGLHRLGWTPAEVLDFLWETLRADRGAWTVGVDGASARFAVGRDDRCTRDGHGGTITAATAARAIRFAITDRVRVLAWPDAAGAPGRIVLAVPRGQPVPRPAVGLTPLGADRDAIRAGDRGGWLYDLGLGSAAARFCLRTADRGLAAELDRRAGQDWSALRDDLGDRPAWAAACRVVANPIVRVEVGATLAPPDAAPRPEPDAGRLALGRETPPGVDLPAAFLPCAIFDPASGGLAAAPRTSGRRPVAADPG